MQVFWDIKMCLDPDLLSFGKGGEVVSLLTAYQSTPRHIPCRSETSRGFRNVDVTIKKETSI